MLYHSDGGPNNGDDLREHKVTEDTQNLKSKLNNLESQLEEAEKMIRKLREESRSMTEERDKLQQEMDGRLDLAPRRMISTSPGPLPRAADEDREPLMALVRHLSNRNLQKKIEILSQHYTHFRRIDGHSSCFYRAFLFSYLENLAHMQNGQAEITRLMQHVATSRESFRHLTWEQSYFSYSQNYFQTLMDEFNTMVDSAANGPSSDERFKSCAKAMRSPKSSSNWWLRLTYVQELCKGDEVTQVIKQLVVEIDIRTRGDEYKSLYPQNFDAIPYCCKKVRPVKAEGHILTIRALTYALGIPLRVEIVDEDLTDQIEEVQCVDFFPRSEWGKGPFSVVQSKWSSSDRTPLLTLLCVRDTKRWYILYR